MSEKNKKNKFFRFHLSVWQAITLGYLLVISFGAFLLCLPISSKQGIWTPFINAFFTATSATCVTGLVIYDTFTHWTTFGHIVILILIQVGGIGFMTIVTLFSILLKKKIGLFERQIIMVSSSHDELSGNVILVKKIILATVIFEGLGAILLAIRFCQDFGFGTGLWYSIFHAISAFCNAGIDIMGVIEPSSSLVHYSNDPLVILTIGALILIGGIGFVVWSDMVTSKFNPKKFTLHTKVVLLSTFSLLFIATLTFFLIEKDNPATLQNKTLGNKILNSIFLAVTPKTAGFNAVYTESLRNPSIFVTMGLMFIGGSSGSTAGGIKITTLVVIIIGFFSIARNREDIEIFKKRIDPIVLKHALIIFSTYLTIIGISTFILLLADNLPIKSALFKSFSALGTVGLSITPNDTLSIVSKLDIILLMIIGRVGVLTIALALGQKKKEAPIKYGIDKIHIG
ncbi:MAG TPA: Trk family potassium uptake protein [Clostridiales bacterium]|nr:Trk family potassium uptake protein [Clostridiales bacterium]